MTTQPIQSATFQPGDKIRIRKSVRDPETKRYAGKHGVVADVLGAGSGALLSVELDGVVGLIALEPAHVINLTAAGKRAWQTTPIRRMGRPKTLDRPKRTVSLRLDVEYWTALVDMIDQGLLPRRDELFNTFLCELTADYRKDRCAERKDAHAPDAASRVS